jgi:HEAT repeat protein
MIAMLKDSDSDVRTAAIEAIFSMASYGMNLLLVEHNG